MADSLETWLDQRFKATDADGVYIGHQPIYGFRKQPSESGHLGRYAITARIVEILGKLRFSSLLDVGGAEGYKAALVRDLFGARVVSCDLSREAAKRARQIYNVDAIATPIHKLPFADGEFDVVLCSEVLEHVPDYQTATRELLRVAKKAVVITVPQEPDHVVRANIARGEMHGHIHAMRPRSFDFVQGVEVMFWGINAKVLKIPRVLGDAGHPRLPSMLKNGIKRVTGAALAAEFIRLDLAMSRSPQRSNGLAVLLLKDHLHSPRPIDAERIVGFVRPPHRPQ